MMEDFEKDIKKYFHEREIQPSENAWERMEQLLDKKQSAGHKHYHYLWTVAASLVLIFGLWSVFKKTNEQTVKNTEQDVFVTNDSVVPKTAQQEKQQIATNNTTEKEEIKTTNRKEPVPKTSVKSQWIPDEETQKETEQFIVETVNIPKPVEVKSKKEQSVLEISSNVEIKVNPEKLLHIAEIERQIDKSNTDGQNFWRKVKEINTVAENHK